MGILPEASGFEHDDLMPSNQNHRVDMAIKLAVDDDLPGLFRFAGRVACMEYDGKLSREDAAQIANYIRTIQSVRPPNKELSRLS